MNIPGYDRYWDDYQAMYDPQWQDEEEEDRGYWDDDAVDEALLERAKDERA